MLGHPLVEGPVQRAGLGLEDADEHLDAAALEPLEGATVDLRVRVALRDDDAGDSRLQDRLDAGRG